MRCQDFGQEPNLHVHKLDGTDVVENGRITCKFELEADLNENVQYMLRLAGQTNTVLVNIERVGINADLHNIYQARGIEALLTH